MIKILIVDLSVVIVKLFGFSVKHIYWISNAANTFTGGRVYVQIPPEKVQSSAAESHSSRVINLYGQRWPHPSSTSSARLPLSNFKKSEKGINHNI